MVVTKFDPSAPYTQEVRSVRSLWGGLGLTLPLPLFVRPYTPTGEIGSLSMYQPDFRTVEHIVGGDMDQEGVDVVWRRWPAS